MIRINKLFCLQTLFTDCQNFTKDGYFEGNLDKQSGENIIFQTAVKNNWYQHPSCTNEFVVKS